ncbi:DUF948 domain-containing protein [Bacillus sp. Marseille-Q1617]|uniref:DUF948 domain-containing protein n=1 Tax=Bacillus sp. Marseille-Q1617 TaxID=2736887 RepID=UPI001589EBD9|nr:DUF948 domain-containing protein [Bacillus sp. Marseille-Q1617]
MWIVYISIAIVIAALIMLVTSILKTLKTTRPIINSINQTVDNMQTNVNRVTAETDQLQTIQGEIQEDIQMKKSSIMYTVEEAKRTPEVAKNFAKSMRK